MAGISAAVAASGDNPRQVKTLAAIAAGIALFLVSLWVARRFGVLVMLGVLVLLTATLSAAAFAL